MINSTQCSSGSLSVTVNASTNQITTSGFAYDSDGNMTKDGTGYTYTFDAESRLTQASGMSGGPWNYTYDGNSLRVKKSNSSGGALYWRSIWGDALAESDLQGNITNEYVFMAGRRIARRDSSGHVYYYYSDALGSPMTITDSSGNPCYVATYTPYGQEMATTNTCPQNYKFTGYEQDAETGLYYAFARYYSPRLGRFLSPDPLAGSTADPQSLNHYPYVGNNPANFVDPLGLDDCTGSAVNGVLRCTTTLKLPSDPVGVGSKDNVIIKLDPDGCAVIIGGARAMCSPSTSWGRRGGPGGPSTGGGTTMSSAPPQPVTPCRIVDPFLAALELTVKLGPELQAGPDKVGTSLYKNVTTGDTGGKMEASAVLVSAQVDNPTPVGGSIGGGSAGAQVSFSFLGFEYNSTTGSLQFKPSKSFTFGLQVLAGGEVSFNSDTFKQVGAANDACRAKGGK